MVPESGGQTCVQIGGKVVANAEVGTDGLVEVGEAIAFIQVPTRSDGRGSVNLNFPLMMDTIVVAICGLSQCCRSRHDGEQEKYFVIICHEFNSLRMGWIDIIWAKIGIFLFGWVFLWEESRDDEDVLAGIDE